MLDDDWKQMLLRITDRVIALGGDRVATGPFAGMQIPTTPSPWDDGNLTCKLTGSYEHELHRAIERALERNPRTIINCGCAEGYYAIGLARRAPQAHVIGYDLDGRSIQACEKWAAINGVGRRVTCLQRAPDRFDWGQGRGLVVMDIEGHEGDALDMRLHPSLATADILVECHDYLRPGVSGMLIERFGDTHAVGALEPRLPNPAHYPYLASLPFGMLLTAISERRPPGTIWLVCWAR